MTADKDSAVAESLAAFGSMLSDCARTYYHMMEELHPTSTEAEDKLHGSAYAIAGLVGSPDDSPSQEVRASISRSIGSMFTNQDVNNTFMMEHLRNKIAEYKARHGTEAASEADLNYAIYRRSAADYLQRTYRIMLKILRKYVVAQTAVQMTEEESRVAASIPHAVVWARWVAQNGANMPTHILDRVIADYRIARDLDEEPDHKLPVTQGDRAIVKELLQAIQEEVDDRIEYEHVDSMDGELIPRHRICQ